ncbi:MAG: hypothetical protein K2L88_04355 [Clostridiales bacterium]|nr:hypothetical protein [Clostridiales bacterium]
MKKILITILSLIAALVMCFSFVACDGNSDSDNPPVNPGNSPTDTDKKPDDDKKPEEDPNAVSIKLNDALEVINGVLDSKGFTATASYSLSTKNTKAETDSIAIEKRGNKIKIDGDILDYETGYWYEYRYDGKYMFSQEMTAGDVDYIKYMMTSFVMDEEAEMTAHYDEETKTVTFYLNLADNVNKYLNPMYTAYGKSKKMGDMLDDYSNLLFGKKFDEVYDLVEAYIKNPKNTFGSLLDLLKEKAGIDVEALLKEFDVKVPAEIMKAVKARKLGEAVVGGYNYIKQVIGDMMGGMMPADVSADIDSDDDDDSASSDGMMSIAMGLYEAMLTSEVKPAQIEAGLAEIKAMMPVLKDLSVKGLIDMALEKNEKLDELYTAIKSGVKFKDISMTVALTIDENKTLTGVKADFLTSHTYTGKAPESYTLLADNDYLISAELKIEEYKTEVADFDIKFSDRADYKQSVAKVVYEVAEEGVSVYFETAGKKVEYVSYMVEIETPDGKTTQVKDVPEGAFKFDEKTSSFVFDAKFVQSVLENAIAGTHLTAFVHFDEDDDTWYGITLVYLNDDIEEVSDYLSGYFMEMIQNMIGKDMPGDTNVSTPNNN